ncbi:hypothetical protein FGKAn22_17730 [Ferrigenium kumadai]|uniref:Uncharacterized protein n=1 Tax=Ferrigenium kumadai TaxID=1682490 RepID=A0AAN1T1A2_9PROT|nr:hypothetical protein [Ferrigenium kumadai]BBJ00081.1 hypothetical protein FGKAn22_17730 [Ferrigenium kumadai]
MNNHAMASVLLAMLFGAHPAIAANGKVTISSPAEGATVAAGQKIKLSYMADTGYEGDHLHLNVDGKRMDVIRQLKGTVEVDALAPGKHKLCLAVNTKGHVPTGPGACVNVTAK